jgi:hypothetical protein
MSAAENQDPILDALNEAIADVDELFALLEDFSAANSLRAPVVLARIGHHLDRAKIRREMKAAQQIRRPE